MSFILVIYIYAGSWANGDSVALQTVSGFKSEAECKTAGGTTASLVKGTAKEARFVCMKQGF